MADLLRTDATHDARRVTGDDGLSPLPVSKVLNLADNA